MREFCVTRGRPLDHAAAHRRSDGLDLSAGDEERLRTTGFQPDVDMLAQAPAALVLAGYALAVLAAGPSSSAVATSAPDASAMTF
jgi:hypothetical protein